MACVCLNGVEQTVTVASLVRHMIPSCPSLPHDLAVDLVRQKYIEAARRSGLLTAVCEIPLQRDVRNYPLDVPEGYEVYAVHPTHHQPALHRATLSVDYWFLCGYRFKVLHNDEIEFAASPGHDREEPMELTVIVVPSECVATMPTAISTPFGRGIAKGALADAMVIPNQAWTNPGIARGHELAYNRTVLDMRTLAITNRGARSPSFQPVRIL